MNSSVYRNGTSFVESLFETFGEFDFQHGAIKYTCIYMYMYISCVYRVLYTLCWFKCKLLSFLDCQLGDLKDITDDLKEDKNVQNGTLKQASGQYKVSS